MPGLLLIALVLIQRLLELALARRNTLRLLARGGHEVGAGHYKLIVALHAAWFLSLVIFGWNASVPLGWFGVYLLLQVFRAWILVSLGPRWTTRIVVIDEPLIRRGPYRFLAHPNYMLVAVEIAIVPLALGLPMVALVFTLLNGAVLTWRIRVEMQALAGTAKLPQPQT